MFQHFITSHFINLIHTASVYITNLISGGSRGGAQVEGGGCPPPSLFLDQTEAQRAEKQFLETWDLPFSKGLDDRP